MRSLYVSSWKLSKIIANKRTPTKTKDNLICQASWKRRDFPNLGEHRKKAHNTPSRLKTAAFTLKSAQKRERVCGWEQQAFAQRAALWEREPLWVKQFVKGQKMIAYELTDKTGLIKTKGHWHTRASPLWRSASCWLKKLTVWVDSSVSMTWPLVEDARPIKKHACAH